MKRSDCLKADTMISAPLFRKRADNSWILACKNQLIPESLYKFYVAADYFSFDKCPKFLEGNQKILFPHLEASVNQIKTSFENYHDLIKLMKKYHSDSYDPIKRVKGVAYDESAPKWLDMYFQLLIIRMYAILDAIAAVIAIVLSWGDLGREEFAKLVDYVKRDLKEGKNVADKEKILVLNEKYFEDIKCVIDEEILDNSNNDWFKLFKAYRNKFAHLRPLGRFLLHDNQGKFYMFLPRQLPYYLQQDITQGETDYDPLNEVIMDIDIFEYCDGLNKKIYCITQRIFTILIEAFKIKKDSGCKIDSDMNKKAKSISRKYLFRDWV